VYIGTGSRLPICSSKSRGHEQRVEAGRPGKKRAKKNIVVCKICRLADPESGEGDIDWVQCEFCDEWGHLECSDINAEEIEEEVCFNCLEYVFFESFPLRKEKNSSSSFAITASFSSSANSHSLTSSALLTREQVMPLQKLISCLKLDNLWG
jgi:hypothetical protein